MSSKREAGVQLPPPQARGIHKNHWDFGVSAKKADIIGQNMRRYVLRRRRNPSAEGACHDPMVLGRDRGRGGFAEESEALFDSFGLSAIVQYSVMPDFHESLRKDVEQESAHELKDVEGHLFSCPAAFVVFV